MLTVRFKKKDDSSKLPTKGSLNAACYDVYAHSITIESDDLEKADRVTINLGFSTEIPPGYKGILLPRSSISKTNWIMANSMGIIDSDYRGEWMMVIRKIADSNTSFPFHVGDRCGQIYFEKVNDVDFEVVDELTDTIRGTGGFGSTGTR